MDMDFIEETSIMKQACEVLRFDEGFNNMLNIIQS